MTTLRVVLIGVLAACIVAWDLVMVRGLWFFTGHLPRALFLLFIAYVIDLPALLVAPFKRGVAALMIACGASYLLLRFVANLAYIHRFPTRQAALFVGLPVLAKLVLAGLSYGGSFARKPG